MWKTLERNISKTVEATAAKFGESLEDIVRYVPDFFQIFVARGRVVAEVQNSKVWDQISRKR